MLRLAVRVRRADAELVLAELLELAPSGVEEVDVDATTVEYAVYGPPGELPELPDLQAAAGAALIEVRTTEVADDWAERWREFHRPLVLGDRLSVRPPWEPVRDTALDLVIDPGRAFGTGAHATTRLCLELLLDVAEPGASGPLAPGPAIDLGCGSGVLAIAAAKLGHAPVLALDYDQLAVDATRENAAVNGVADLVQARRFDLRTGAGAAGAAGARQPAAAAAAELERGHGRCRAPLDHRQRSAGDRGGRGRRRLRRARVRPDATPRARRVGGAPLGVARAPLTSKASAST